MEVKMTGPGARFSKAPKTFRARKAIFNYLYLKNKVVYRRENLCWSDRLDIA